MTIFVKVAFKICKPGHIGVNIAWVDVVHNDVLSRIGVHLTLVDPDRDCFNMMVVMMMMVMIDNDNDDEDDGHDVEDGDDDGDDVDDGDDDDDDNDNDLLSALQPIFDTT